MLKEINQIPIRSDGAYEGRDYEHQRGFDELKEDIRTVIAKNIMHSEITVNGYAESGKIYAIFRARQEVLNEMVGIARNSIFGIHDKVINVSSMKIDGTRRFFLTYNPQALAEFKKIARTIG